MRIISINRNRKLEELIPQLKKQDRAAQKELFDRTSRKMMAVCRSYISDFHHAEDCLLKAFVKVFKGIGSYNSDGSFEGWIRRIMVNECLDFIRQNKSMMYLDEFEVADTEIEYEEDLTGIDVQELLDKLPENYRMVFNLFVLEEYSHKEIAEKLQINEAASRTLLARAKKKLKEILSQQNEKANEK